MDNILRPEQELNLDQLSLGHPVNSQGNSYFTKLAHKSQPLFLQAPVCVTKQGIIKNGKKCYCDLMFTADNQEMLEWFENVVEKLQSLIFEKRSDWFHNEMDLTDIENAFTHPIRTYKSGRCYLLRVNINSDIRTGMTNLQCYDEDENPVDPSSIDSEKVQVIPLLEIKGVTFSSRSFSLDINLKQLMVFKEPETNQSCLIQKNIKNQTLAYEEENNENVVLDVEENLTKEDENTDIIVEANENEIEEEVDNKKEEVEKNPETLEEINISLDELNEDESIQLKNRNEVYYEIWKQARIKAKESKKQTIRAYLEAKKIKNTYMLDELEDDSDDELDLYLEESQPIYSLA
jgi:hypothetical protein